MLSNLWVKGAFLKFNLARLKFNLALLKFNFTQL